MRLLKHGVAMVLLAAGATTAHAEINPADLAVEGTIKAPACTASQTENGEYRYSGLSLSKLPVTGHYPLEPKTQTWRVDCHGANTYLSFSVVDNRADTESSGGNAYAKGLGRMEGVALSKIGYFELVMLNGAVDGTPKSTVVYDTTNEFGRVSPAKEMRALNRYIRFSWATNAADTGWNYDPSTQLGSVFEMDLRVKPYLASASVVGGGQVPTEKVDMDGMLTISYAFGI